MIFTERKITVNKGKSTIDRPAILYRGDYEVEIRFTIVDTDFKYINGNNNNATEKASHAQLAILGPDGTNVFSDISVCMGGQVAFVLTKEMIDELREVGLYSFQIRLFDYYRESRVTIPPVEYGIEVREPVASEDHTNAVDNSMVGYSIAKTSVLDEPVGPTFDVNGQYNKTDWETGDRISEGRLNKIEDAIGKINRNEKADVAALDKRVTSNYNVLNSNKADIKDTNNLQTQINNLVLGAVGDGNNAEVVQARGTFSVLNDRLNFTDSRMDMVSNGYISYSVVEDVPYNAGYIRSADRVIIGDDPNYVYTDFIAIDPQYKIDYNVHAQKEVYIMSFYDKALNFISGVSTDKTMYNLSSGSITPPQNAYYVKFCWANSINQGATTVTDSYIYIYVDNKKEMENIKSDVKELKEKFITEEDLLSNITLSVGYMQLNGTVEDDSNWVTSDYIDVHAISSFDISYVSHTAVAYVTFYDDTKTKIGHLESIRDSLYYTQNVVVPNGVYYVRVSSCSEKFKPDNPLKVVCKKNTHLFDLETKIYDIKNDVSRLTSNILDLVEISKIGYLHVDGFSVTTGDANWFYTEYIKVTNGDILEVSVKGHEAVGSICIYDENKKLISVQNSETGGMINTTITLTGTGYIRVSGGSESFASAKPVAILTNSTINIINDMKEDIIELQQSMGVNKQDIDYISPYKVYTVCNDVGGKKGHNRNYAAAVYLDHFFNGFTEEKNIRFDNNSDKVVVFSPMTVMDSNENNPAVTYNEGVNILTKNKEYLITGNDIADTTFRFTHVSTLNSKTVNMVPRVLCIGDSITYAELAQVNDDDHSQNWAYHLMCKELYMKDNIDNGGSGYDIKFLGHFRKTRKMKYKDSEYDVVTYHEGIRGITLDSYLNGGVSDFRSNTTGKFSLNAWLSKYRTLDDNGNRLTLGNGTGSAITSANLQSIDVCTPTHVFIMLGANGGGTLNAYKELINIIKSEYPNMIIGLAIPDCAGTYFPSLHPNCDEKMTIWNDTGSQGSRHNTMYNLVDMLQNEFCTEEYEAQNIYFVPFYFVQPTAESCSMRKVNLPCADIRLMHHNTFNANYGWHASTHVNGIGHMNWAYQLYSWIKYTIAKNK